MNKLVKEKEALLEQKEQQVKEFKEHYIRALADAENTRKIAQRDIENASRYGVSSFAKELLEVADNLYRAMECVQIGRAHV